MHAVWRREHAVCSGSQTQITPGQLFTQLTSELQQPLAFAEKEVAALEKVFTAECNAHSKASFHYKR